MSGYHIESCCSHGQTELEPCQLYDIFIFMCTCFCVCICICTELCPIAERYPTPIAKCSGSWLLGPSLRSYGRWEETFEIAQCSGSAHATIPFLTMRNVKLDETGFWVQNGELHSEQRSSELGLMADIDAGLCRVACRPTMPLLRAWNQVWQ